MRLPAWLWVPAVASVLGACQAQSGALPDTLLGTWTTEAPKYQDRFFELTPDHLTFGTGGGTSSRDPITHIEQTKEDGRAVYHIQHQSTEGQTYTFSFYYEPQDGGTITLQNQAQIQWNRERDQRP